MPLRPERFFWIYMSEMDGARAAVLDAENKKLAQHWPSSACRLSCETCVSDRVPSPRIWLYRLATIDNALISRFNGQLSQHIVTLSRGLGAGLKIKHQRSLPQPLVINRLERSQKTDVGLHSVNDVYNGMLVTYSYYEGRRYHIPHLQLSTLVDLCSAVRAVWGAVACACSRRLSNCSCQGVGCYDCFDVACSLCSGTGWKDFATWAKAGYQIDYSSGMPVARY